MAQRTCTIAGCDKPTDRKGWCSRHYSSWKRRGDPLATSRTTCQSCGTVFKREGKPGLPKLRCPDCRAPRSICPTCDGPLPRSMRTDGTLAPAPKYCSDDCRPRCAVEGCGQHVRKRGWCASHYAQWHKVGEVTPFKYKWAAVGSECVVCGAAVTPGTGRRKHCSGRCQMLDCMHKGARPKTGNCVRCGIGIDFLAFTKTGQFRRTDTKLCRRCKQDVRKFGMSVEELAQRDGQACGICGDLVDMGCDRIDPFRPSIDHIVPRANGGKDEPENYQLSHLWCNQVKNNREGFVI